MSRHTSSDIHNATQAANHRLTREAEAVESGFIERGQRGYRPTMLALFLGAFSTFVLLYCVQPLMPILSDAFGIDAATSSLSLSVSTGMLAIGLLITGPISDAVGRKSVMTIALLAASTCTLLAAVMPNWTGILVMRALAGLSLSGLCAVAMTYLNEEIHPRYVGLSMGLYISGNSIGGMSGRLISGVMVDWVPWRWTLATIGIVLYAAAMWVTGIMEGLMWREVDANGFLVNSFADTVAAKYPMYVVRALGGLLYVSGAIIMCYNLWMTVRRSPAVEARAAAAHATPAE